MGRVNTDDISLSYAIQSAEGVALPTSGWKLLEPNDIGRFGPEFTKVSRSPISRNRQRRKGSVTDADYGVEFEQDATLEIANDFLEALLMSTRTSVARFLPTAVTSTGYTVASGGAIPNDTLFYARGFPNAANNGLKVAAGTSTATEVKCTGLVAETPAATLGASIEVCGRRGATGDLQIDASGDLISTTLNFTTLNLTVGQSIFIGGEATANRFANAANRGYARIDAIAANKLTLSRCSQAFTTDAGTGKNIDIFFGPFIRNVAVDHASFLDRWFAFEAAYPGLNNPSGDMYEYARDHVCNTGAFTLPLTNKATVNFGFIGKAADDPTATRATGANAPTLPQRTAMINTTADIARLRVIETDESGLTTDFKQMTLTIGNNRTAEKVIGVLGAKYINKGMFTVDMEAEIIFSDADVISAIRANRTVGIDFVLRNEDGALLVDIPSATLGNGAKQFPRGESVRCQLSGEAYQDATLGYSVGVTVFPYAPAS